MARNVRFELRRGAGSPLEVLYGKVSLTPTMQHSVSSAVVLPAPSTFDLINGVAIATNVSPSPDPVEGMVEWAYIVKIVDTHGKSFEFMVGVPDGTTEINFNVLPRYFATKPPLFGAGPQGVPGEAATIAVGTVVSAETPAVTNSGTNKNAVLNFTLAKGDKGDTGAPGTGVSIDSTKLFADLPATYTPGVTTTNGNIANGWPVDFLTVVTEVARTGDRVVQTMTNVVQSYFAQRVAQNNVWQPLKQIAYATPATTSANGLMIGADKVKLDSSTSTNTASTLVRRDANNRYESAEPLTDLQVANKGYVDNNSGAVNASKYPSVQAAVDVAYTLKKPLLVDADLIDANVDKKFFELEVFGRGSITIGANKYWVNPQHQGIQTNTLYLDPTNGNNNNSGINPSAPIKTFTQLNINLSMLREKLLDGFWRIIIKAGTHQIDSGWRMDGLRTKWPLKILGEGTLATILDGASDSLGKALYFKHFETSIEVDNIQFQNYQGEGDGIDTNAGILVQGPGFLRVTNCRFEHTTTGIHLGYAASGTINNNYFLGSQVRSTSSSISTGISVLYGASATIGTSLATRNTFNKCVTGVHVTRNAVAHVDYNYHLDNYYGIRASHNARIAILDGDILRNVVGVEMTGGSECTFATANFGSGTSNANTEHNVRFSGSARFTQYQGAYPAATEYRLYGTSFFPPMGAPTGTGNMLINTFPSSASIPADVLYGLNKKIRFRVEGFLSGTGSRDVKFTKNDRTGANAQDLVSITIPSGHSGYYTLEFEMYKSDYEGNFRTVARLQTSGQPNLVVQGYTSGLDLKHDWLFRMYKTDSVGTLGMNIYAQEIYVLG